MQAALQTSENGEKALQVFISNILPGALSNIIT